MMKPRRSASNSNIRPITSAVAPPMSRQYAWKAWGWVSVNAFAPALTSHLQVLLIKSVPDDFNVHFIQILLRNAIDEEGGW